jgi:hypothetical protein
MFDLYSYVGNIIQLCDFDFGIHAPALKSFSPAIDFAVSEYMQSGMSAKEFDNLWARVKPTNISDPADLAFLVHNKQAIPRNSEAVAGLLPAMHRKNMTAFHHWCGLWLSCHGIWFSLRSEKWFRRDKEIRPWYLSETLGWLIRDIRAINCADKDVFSTTVESWLETGNYPRYFLLACHNRNAQRDFP